jgi:hypothetical protein
LNPRRRCFVKKLICLSVLAVIGLAVFCNGCDKMKAEEDLSAFLPPKIALVRGESVYISRGTESGVAAGELFNVLGPGPEITDPDTFEILGFDEPVVAVLRVARVMDRMSECSLEWIADKDVPVIKGMSCEKAAVPFVMGMADSRQEAHLLNW